MWSSGLIAAAAAASTYAAHILRHQPGRASLDAYKKELCRPVDERVLTLVVDWVRRTAAAPVA
ncbi:hypothetical protein [Cellulomonas palmilytica]|uniref:hypothetical protein n=1 Tax=Cellulomonas palmilytica TaxID=2608402 RepID=UPI001F2C9BFB|nr:hypothetical protein [Cellulomonas palmilytica]UJP39996.1 hypothetical protein F1D97_00030 [Cellulomonas palmilytica]